MVERRVELKAGRNAGFFYKRNSVYHQ